ncbi:DNA-binding protein YbiB [Acidithiobacillus caldus]|uniref:DNA-binding protein YbiB n=1 Tax=Acidithiobacillus caldus TaxID=33059 RepID=UPI00059F5E76|nr:DNA-binding protein YbiB [Acidithiobacillus caldus]MBU2783729.1 DNA-binding protein YbiB [Acidithiobacillus caldus]MBU2789554.1 DNA-binding protein YbiB [Acidithiobacillus caldus]MBU2822117.1 DNA-binding protein YbiB [Acidithiobacillus caldus]
MNTWKSYLSRVARGRDHAGDLNRKEAEIFFSAWLDGALPDLLAGAFWVAYRIKGESLEELQGFHDALRSDIKPLSRPSRLLPVVFASYNGTRRRANLLPLLALALTRCGVPVIVHGPDLHTCPTASPPDSMAETRVFSAQIFQHLGLASASSLAEADTLLRLQGLVYLPLSAWLPGLQRIFALRGNLGIRSSVHTLVKILHPFAPREAVVCAAVTHPPYLQRLQEFFLQTKMLALCFRATEGEPFANPQRCPDLFTCQQGSARLLLAKDKMPVSQLVDLPENTVSATSAFTLGVLNGQYPLPQPLAKQAAALLLMSGRCGDLTSARRLLRRTFSRIAA